MNKRYKQHQMFLVFSKGYQESFLEDLIAAAYKDDGSMTILPREQDFANVFTITSTKDY